MARTICGGADASLDTNAESVLLRVEAKSGCWQDCVAWARSPLASSHSHPSTARAHPTDPPSTGRPIAMWPMPRYSCSQGLITGPNVPAGRDRRPCPADLNPRATLLLRLALFTALTSFGFAPSLAEAAGIDRASRSDVSDFRSPTVTVPIKPGADKFIVQGNQFALVKSVDVDAPSFTVTPGVSASYATNAGQTSTNPIQAAYVTPGLALEYIQPKLIGSWKFDATLTADTDFYDKQPDDLDEGRLDADFVVSRPTGVGLVFMETEFRDSLNRSFSRSNYLQERYKVGFQPTFGKPLNLKLTAEYRASDVAEQRRTLLALAVSRFWEGQGKRPSFNWKELVQFSHFRAGANADRNDVFTKSSLDITWKAAGFEVGLDATLFKNFSNRGQNRYLDFEFGPTLSRTF